MEDSFSLRPREVFEELRKTVVGQDDALREIAVAVVKHLVGHPAPNILLIGNSGSGKTTLMRAVEQFVGGRPGMDEYANVVRINANVLAEEHSGYGRAVLGRLLANPRRRSGSTPPRGTSLGLSSPEMSSSAGVNKFGRKSTATPNVAGTGPREAPLPLLRNR